MPSISNKYTILLVGISGDLAARKILPSIGEIVLQNPDKRFKLVGLSRSNQKPEAIFEKLKLEGSVNNFELELIQGNYDDHSLFVDIITKSIGEDGTRLFVYLAIPPLIFLSSIQQFCPYSTLPIDIIVDKPYATSKQDLEKLLALIHGCDLKINVHFFDHYLLKDNLAVQNPQIATNIQSELQDLTPTQIHIQSLEDIDIANRFTSYNNTGAIEDMVPHLFSLLLKYNREYNLKLAFDELEISEVSIGQYKAYQDITAEISKTETYFKIQFKCQNSSIVFESGKKQATKIIDSKFFFSNNQSLQIELYPTLSVSLNNQILASDESKQSEHFKLFQNLINRDMSFFLSEEEIRMEWNLISEIKDFITTHEITLNIY